MKKRGAILAFYPLHEYVELTVLQKNWLVFFQLPWNAPVDDIKVGHMKCVRGYIPRMGSLVCVVASSSWFMLMTFICISLD